MAETRALQDGQQIDTLVNIITQTADPEQVILFGSQVGGAAQAESDYDFSVMKSMNGQSSWLPAWWSG